MGEFEKDFVMRQIRQLAQLVARVVLRARSEGQVASGLEQIREAVESCLGMDYAMLSRIDPASAALLVHDGEVLRTLAWIAAQEGELHESAGDLVTARHQRCRAVALYAECSERFPGEDAACREAARALAGGAGLELLADKYRRWLGLPAPAS